MADINGHGSDDQVQKDYKNAQPTSTKPAKQLAAELLPSRHALSTITGGDVFQRSMGNYAKNAPDADSMGVLGLNMNTFGA